MSGVNLSGWDWIHSTILRTSVSVEVSGSGGKLTYIAVYMPRRDALGREIVEHDIDLYGVARERFVYV